MIWQTLKKLVHVNWFGSGGNCSSISTSHSMPELTIQFCFNPDTN